MVALAGIRSERRKHPRNSGCGLLAEIRGKRYEVLDISFGGMKIGGRFTVPGGLVDAVILPMNGKGAPLSERAEVRGRVERVDDDLTAVRFSNLTPAAARLIDKEEGGH